MRLWSIHPKYLDTKGLVALWREALLAQKVLEGKTNGYKNHPQLDRFKKTSSPLKFIGAYLMLIFNESKIRGYNFDENKILKRTKLTSLKKINVTKAQVDYETNHLLQKLKARSYNDYKRLVKERNKSVFDIFNVTKGKIESWEKL